MEVKFVSYRMGGAERLGILTSDCQAVSPVPDFDGRSDPVLLDLIDAWGSDGADSVLPGDREVPLSSVELLAPLPNPRRNIFCVGKNYREHVAEFDRSGFNASTDGSSADVPSEPIFFTKAPTSVVGPGVPIDPHPEITSCLDYEAEIGVIIGRRARNIDPAKAMDYVWGFTLINDVTARDVQKDRRQWFLGKSLDTFCPMGPWAVTADELDPGALELECRVNDELRQQGNTADLIFDIPTLLADLSRGITLVPGDVLATGTPAGVGAGFDPPRFLSAGDVVRVSATGLGELVNPVG